MKRRLLAACATLALAGLPASQGFAADTPSGTAFLTAASSASGKPAIGSFGFDTAGMDRTVAPGNDFFAYANGTWARTTAIPDDRPSWGVFPMLTTLSEERTRAIIEDAAATNAPHGSTAQKVGDYFASFMDERAIEVQGLKPLKPELDRISAIRTRSDLARALAAANRDGVATPFVATVQQDLKENNRYRLYFIQGGLGLPERTYYLDDKNPKFAELRAKYEAHVATTLRLAGYANPEARAKAIVALERKIAEAHLTNVEMRQIDKLYNKVSRGDLEKRVPGVDWAAILDGVGAGKEQEFVIATPTALSGAATLIANEPLATWIDYLTFHTIRRAAPVLPAAFAEANFDFYGRTLAGTPQMKERWKRGVDLVNAAMGEAVGKLYVERHFPPEAKAKADALVRGLIAAMDARLARLDWMAPETKAKARTKLASFRAKIGYPDSWRDYSTLEIVRGDHLGNALRAQRFEYARNLGKLGRPVDRNEWALVPQTVNAYANPLLNEVVFPAAILQPPFFDPNADPAVNFGAIGAVIGHEIVHHFDDQGRKFDASGNLAEWWTPADIARFKEHTDNLVAQYAEYEPVPGTHVNGELTLGENIADLAGLTIAYDAYKNSLGGKPAPVIDGLTGDQRFFLGWAQVWRTKYREALLRQVLAVDPHTPGHYRQNVSRNLDAWYDAFDVKPGQTLYLAPDKRIRIW